MYVIECEVRTTKSDKWMRLVPTDEDHSKVGPVNIQTSQWVAEGRPPMMELTVEAKW